MQAAQDARLRKGQVTAFLRGTGVTCGGARSDLLGRQGGPEGLPGVTGGLPDVTCSWATR